MDGFRVVTLDLSPRVNRHLDTAMSRAERGEGYVLQLPLDADRPGREWLPELADYWRQFGDRLGEAATATPPPAGVDVRVRAVRVSPPSPPASGRPTSTSSCSIWNRLSGSDRFDLIVATNVLVYYDRLEQALALANIAKMLNPGGLFLTNYEVSPAPPLEDKAIDVMPVFWDHQRNGDTLYAYRRSPAR